jgi:hydroxyethylthiazole kinase-like uncharacterized protein yjeF
MIMIVVTAEDIKKLDDWAIREKGIPDILLMENAGRSVAQYAISAAPKMARACVIAGTGNNGGDGFVAARHLFAHGVNVNVHLLGGRSQITASAKTNLEILEKLQVPVIDITEDKHLEQLAKDLKNADVVIDAIFGVSFHGEVDGLNARAIDLINSSKIDSSNGRPYFVVAVDIPSGVDPDSGACGAHSVNADMTVTFTYVKKGLVSYPAIDKVGKLVITDIGIPKFNPLEPKTSGPIAQQNIKDINIITPDLIAAKLPPRSRSANKGACGEVVIIAGSYGMSGAAMLAGKAALRIGAGLVRLCVPKSIAVAVDAELPEVITVAMAETGEGTISGKALEKAVKLCLGADAVAIGPGLTTAKETSRFILGILASYKKLGIKAPLIIDADALNSIAQDPTVLDGISADIIVTPHPGEMSRLTGLDIDQIQNSRVEMAKKFSSDHDVVTVLKGARTIVASPKGETRLNITGNPAMATAGMGDVLTGVIAGLAAQGMDAFNAAASGAFIHGMAGDVSAALKGDRGIIASDVCEALPFVLKTILS